MPWQQLMVRVAADELARTEALLRLAGATSVAITDDAGEALLEPEPGTTPLWSRLTLRALFDADLDLSSIHGVLDSDGRLALEIEQLDDDELARSARQTVEPLEIGPRLRVVPAERLQDNRHRVIGLHMGLAFGTGQHPTTRLCLTWLHDAAVDSARVLDYGCGTGVLALAALKLGAESATAIDNEPQALDATRRNAKLNGYGPKITTGDPESLDAAAEFDLVLANILAQPLLRMADDFADRQAPGGQIVLSGILVSQLDSIEAHYARHYEHFERRELGEWGLLSGRRRNGYDR